MEGKREMLKNQRKKKIPIWIGIVEIVIAICSIFLIFINSENTKENKTTERIAVILPKEDTNPFWKTVWDGVRDCSEEKEIWLSEYQYDSFSDDNVENLLEMTILSKTDAIILRASDYTSDRMKNLLKNAKEEEIAIILIDSDTQQELRDIFVGVDNIEVGKKAASTLIEHYQPKRILEIRNDGNPTSVVMREQAFYEWMQSINKEDMISSIVLSGAEQVRYQTAQKFLMETEKGDAIVCFGANTTLIAAKTIERLGMQDTIFLMGFGESEEAIEYVKSGEIDLLFAQENYKMGYKAVECAIQILKDDKIQDRDNTYINIVAITKEEIEENR